MTDRTLFCVPPGMRLPHYAAGATLVVEYEVREGRNVLAHVPTVQPAEDRRTSLSSIARAGVAPLTEPRVVQGALDCLEDLGWIRAEAMRARDGGRPTVRVRINPRLPAGRHDRSRRVPPEASESP